MCLHLFKIMQKAGEWEGGWEVTVAEEKNRDSQNQAIITCDQL